MKLPLIKSSKDSTSKLIIKDKFKIIQETSPSKEKKIETFAKKLSEIQEIKIYLNKNFNAYDVDEGFIKDMEIEYAEQYLNKLEMLPTKNLINKVLLLRPLEKCDFYLTNESTLEKGVEKQMKIVHIYPNSYANISKNKSKSKLNQSEDNKQNNIKNYLSKNIQSTIKMKYSNEDKNLKEKIISIKKNNKNELDYLIYNKEKIDEIFNKEMDDMAELKLFSQKNTVNVDLSFENIKKKYIIIKKIEDYQTSDKILNSKGKFYNIGNSVSGQKNLLNDPKYAFDITEINNLNNDIIKEVSEPIDIQLELIMKDLNFILDNFPMDKFINIDDDTKTNKNNNKNKRESPNRSNSQEFNKVYKLNLDKQEQIIQLCKIFHSMEFYRLICLTLNLIYWIVFGNQNNVQIDKNTKEYLYLKLLTQIDIVNSMVTNPKLLTKVFIPLEIVIIRIEIDNYLSRKFIRLFDEETSNNKKKIMVKINNVITEIFDKHGYMNSFDTICGSQEEFNRKLSVNFLPRFKKKIFATSNMVEQLFNNDKRDIGKSSMANIRERQEFILGPKVDFFNSYLQKINTRLKKRNLAPIFTVSNNQNKISDKKTDELIDTKHRRELNIFIENDNNIPSNERYIKVEKYMDNSVKKFKDLFLKPIHSSKSTVFRASSNRQVTK